MNRRNGKQFYGSGLKFTRHGHGTQDTGDDKGIQSQSAHHQVRNKACVVVNQIVLRDLNMNICKLELIAKSDEGGRQSALEFVRHVSMVIIYRQMDSRILAMSNSSGEICWSGDDGHEVTLA